MSEEILGMSFNIVILSLFKDDQNAQHEGPSLLYLKSLLGSGFLLRGSEFTMRLISKEQRLHLEMATAWFVVVYAS